MRILMMDTSGPICGVAIGDEEGLLWESSLKGDRSHSVQLMPMVEEALDHTGLAIQDIELFGAVTGPGSFTGIRIGISTAKALAHASGKPCFGMDALEALAANGAFFPGVLCPILDARAAQVYTALFRAVDIPTRLCEDRVIKLDALLDELLPMQEDVLFLGDGVKNARVRIAERLGQRAHFAPAEHVGARAGSACALAARKIQEGEALLSCYALSPQYLRASQAERERQARQEAQA